jgi:hypothetical protein
VILRHYGLEANLIGSTDPTGSFLSELLPITAVPPSALSPTVLPQLYHNENGVTVVEVKDLRQTIAIETDYEISDH